MTLLAAISAYISYYIRPYDPLSDRRRWCWQPRSQCEVFTPRNINRFSAEMKDMDAEVSRMRSRYRDMAKRDDYLKTATPEELIDDLRRFREIAKED